MLSEKLQIQPIGMSDAATILHILHAAFAEYRGKIDPPSGAHTETLASVQGLITHERGLLAQWEDEIVGCVFFEDRPAALYLHRLAVLPKFRRRGISKALVEAVESMARQLEKTRVTLNVRVALPQNRAYYEKLGYAITGFDFHKGYNQFTFVNLEKMIDQQDLRNVEVVPYNAAWTVLFQAEAELLQRVFSNQLVAIEHIGSTAIPGIQAKPIIDMLPVVKNIERMSAFDPTMLALGYEPKGEFGLAGRRYYRKGGHDHRSHHVHVYEAHNPAIDRHLAFRDYLIAHASEAARYSNLKQELAQQHPQDIYAYMDGKDGLVQELQAKALVWWREMRD